MDPEAYEKKRKELLDDIALLQKGRDFHWKRQVDLEEDIRVRQQQIDELTIEKNGYLAQAGGITEKQSRRIYRIEEAVRKQKEFITYYNYWINEPTCGTIFFWSSYDKQINKVKNYIKRMDDVQAGIPPQPPKPRPTPPQEESTSPPRYRSPYKM